MKMAMDLAMRFFKLDYNECLNAATINAAYSLNRSSIIGSLEAGKQADVLVINAPTLRDYLHQAGDGRIDYVIKRGLVSEI